jgi:hypothetical protein
MVPVVPGPLVPTKLVIPVLVVPSFAVVPVVPVPLVPPVRSPVFTPNPANSVDVREPEVPTPNELLGVFDPVYVLAVLVPVPPTSLNPGGVPPIKKFGSYVDCPKSVLPSGLVPPVPGITYSMRPSPSTVVTTPGTRLIGVGTEGSPDPASLVVLLVPPASSKPSPNVGKLSRFK